jgi:hypothetical protein
MHTRIAYQSPILLRRVENEKAFWNHLFDLRARAVRLGAGQEARGSFGF